MITLATSFLRRRFMCIVYRFLDISIEFFFFIILIFYSEFWLGYHVGEAFFCFFLLTRGPCDTGRITRDVSDCARLLPDKGEQCMDEKNDFALIIPIDISSLLFFKHLLSLKQNCTYLDIPIYFKQTNTSLRNQNQKHSFSCGYNSQKLGAKRHYILTKCQLLPDHHQRLPKLETTLLNTKSVGGRLQQCTKAIIE